MAAAVATTCLYDPGMTEADRRFYRRLLMIAGPAFVVGGFLAAFTLVGALLIFAGLGMFLSGLLLWTRLPVPVVAGCGAITATALTVYMAVTLP